MIARYNLRYLKKVAKLTVLQDFVKALFADEEMNKNHRLAAVNSINWARILAQITYYFASYFAISRSSSTNEPIRFVVPTGNFGDILAGYFAKRMGLPIEKLVIATNDNDILHRFWRSGAYEKKPAQSENVADGFVEDGAKAHEDGAKETLSPAMDILVSSNFERLLWFLAYEGLGHGSIESRRHTAGAKVRSWLGQLKSSGGFKVEPEILDAARENFESERVSDEQTVETIKEVFSWPNTPGAKAYILDPHSAVGVNAALRSIQRSPKAKHIALSTAHPAKFSKAVEMALSHVNEFTFMNVLPKEFVGMEDLPRKVIHVRKSDGLQGLRELVIKAVEIELTAASS
jgi:threonine synthase